MDPTITIIRSNDRRLFRGKFFIWNNKIKRNPFEVLHEYFVILINQISINSSKLFQHIEICHNMTIHFSFNSCWMSHFVDDHLVDHSIIMSDVEKVFFFPLFFHIFMEGKLSYESNQFYLNILREIQLKEKKKTTLNKFYQMFIICKMIKKVLFPWIWKNDWITISINCLIMRCVKWEQVKIFVVDLIIHRSF